ncbi:MAG: TIGR03862 family flavoprotein [Bacteroidales bacterium]|nr:TIGR03862 family flavoprotein [Bacteroidales bacterium]
MTSDQIIIVGGGPAGLMAADRLSETFAVSLFEKENTIGKKLLLAGKGSFNITNNLPEAAFISRYSPPDFMQKALHAFNNNALQQWLSDMGIPTFVGTSGRVFPAKEIKAGDVLDRITTKLVKQGVRFYQGYKCTGFDADHGVIFDNRGQTVVRKGRFIIFALGGASWPVTGSDGKWLPWFESMGIATKPFEASNCGVNIRWPKSIVVPHAGKPLKNLSISTSDTTVKGEAIITDYGLEGNAIYPLVPSIRRLLNQATPANINLDLKPQNSLEELIDKTTGKIIPTKSYGRFFGLNTVQMAVIKAFTSKEQFLSAPDFVHRIKSLTIPVDSLRPVAEAISTIGGIPTDELNNDFSLKKYPWIFTIGEMVDWDAPTGGFLLQGCFAMGNYAAQSILQQAAIHQ